MSVGLYLGVRRDDDVGADDDRESRLAEARDWPAELDP